MATVRFSRLARRDLIAIWRAIAGHDVDAADRIYPRIERACADLSRCPGMEPRRLALHPEGRILVFDRWLVVYRATSDIVRVLRVLDGRRDLTIVGPEGLKTSSPNSAFDASPCELGEGPRWDVATQSLVFLDIAGHAIHRFTPANGAIESFATAKPPGFAVLDTRGHLVAGLGDGIFDLGRDGTGARLLARPDMHPENRFNDAGVDPRGRLWAGTMHADASRDRAPTGALYRIDPSGPVTFATGIGIANGLGWSPDGSTMYFAETHLGTVWAYDYDLATGTPSNRRALAEVAIDVGVPDGLTVDARGYVHVAIWRGARINIYTPDGRLDEMIAMPVPSATSCCFGGEDLRTLYVTTDGRRLSGERPDDPLPGRVFALRRDAPGVPCPRMRPLAG